MARSRSRRPLHVLMVAYYFPPIATSASMRPLAFCRYLPAGERSIRVIASAPETVVPRLEVDPRLADCLPGHVAVDRVEHHSPLDTAIAWRDRMRGAVGLLRRPNGANGHAAPPASAAGDAGSRFGALKERALHRLFEFPDRQRFWRAPAIRRGMQLGADARPDLVFATGGPWTSLLVGQRLAAHYGVPWIADFRDPWRRNPFLTPLAAALSHRTAELERSICTSAARVITNTSALQRQFESDYPDLDGRFVTITNGFDADLFTAAPAPAAAAVTRPLTLGHFGTVYGQRSPEALLRALRALADAGAGPESVHVRFVGRWEVVDDAVNALADDLERRGFVSRGAPVPHAECQRQMRQVDALLVLQGGAPLQIPGKIYEYIATGRPLLMLGGEGATAALLTDGGLGTCCADEPRSIRELLSALVDGRARLTHPAPDATARFHYRSLTERLDGILEDVVHRAHGRPKEN